MYYIIFLDEGCVILCTGSYVPSLWFHVSHTFSPFWPNQMDSQESATLWPLTDVSQLSSIPSPWVKVCVPSSMAWILPTKLWMPSSMVLSTPTSCCLSCSPTLTPTATSTWLSTPPTSFRATSALASVSVLLGNAVCWCNCQVFFYMLVPYFLVDIFLILYFPDDFLWLRDITEIVCQHYYHEHFQIMPEDHTRL